MKKMQNIPFVGSYGLNSQFRWYSFLDENNKENYKKDILKCLEYDILYHILPNHKSGNNQFDTLLGQRTLDNKPIHIDSNTLGLIFSESIRGNQSGEIVVTYKLSKDKKSLELTLYDRDIILQPVRTSIDEDEPAQYALVDNIVESKIVIKKGQKLSTKDITVCHRGFGSFLEHEHSYENALAVIKDVKKKSDHPIEDPTDLLEEEHKQEETKNNKK